MNSLPSQNNTDPWTQLSSSSIDVQLEPTQSELQIENISGVEPLDTQIGVFPKKAVPYALHDALFGQPKPTEDEIEAAGGDPAAVTHMNTYAILDAAKVANLPELLERSGLEHRCLFKGEAYDELRDVGPWIVRLEAVSVFTRCLFTRSEASWHLWDREPGIYIRSRCALDGMWRHARKFTRVQDENGSWAYFNFWRGYVPFALATDAALHPIGHSFFRPMSSVIMQADGENKASWTIIKKRRG